jgi:ribose transport system substrate-binding protein
MCGCEPAKRALASGSRHLTPPPRLHDLSASMNGYRALCHAAEALTRALRFAPALLLLLAVAGCAKRSAAPEGGDAQASALKFAVIPKGTTHEFWKSVHAGAVKASRELGVEVVWKGPLREDDLKGQIDLVQSFAAQGVSGIALAPLNDKALVSAVRGAVRSGVPVVVFDSALEGKEHTSFVATDNRAAGRLAGERLAGMLQGKGRVVLLRYQEGSASTHARETGFLEAVRKHAQIEVVSDNQYGGPTTESAFAASENVLLAQNAADGLVDAIFCPNESTTFGMLLALRKSGLAGKIRFVGFDASDKLVQALRAGHIHGLVLQDPFRMGYLAVRTMSVHLRGERVEPRIDTGSRFVTSSNMDEPQIRQLLQPDLAKWLGK